MTADVEKTTRMQTERLPSGQVKVEGTEVSVTWDVEGTRAISTIQFDVAIYRYSVDTCDNL